MFKAIVIGASYGGLEAIRTILCGLPRGFNTPVMVVLHIGSNNIQHYISLLNKECFLQVKEADEKELIKLKTVYFAPPNYHLQVEDENTLGLSTDEKVNFSRPAIDVLFETAAWTFGPELLGILLTGSNSDGARGLKTIKDFGGTTIIENPETAFAGIMPKSGIALSPPDYVIDLKEIARQVNKLIPG